MKTILIISDFLLGFVLGVILLTQTIIKNQKKRISQLDDSCYKFKEFYEVLNQWLRVHQSGKDLSKFLIAHNYRSIAIYGMRELGEALLNELKGSEVEVKYAIDRNAEDIYAEVDIYRPEDELEKVDVVIVTAIHWFDEIEVNMKEKIDCPILSLDDILFEM